MDRTVPPGAALLLDFIGDIEGPEGYDTIYANRQNLLAKPVTAMTLAEIQAAQPGWSKRFGSSATGRYQFMQKTLAELIDELGLSMSQRLDADLQDRLAYHLLKRRGYDDFMAGRVGRIAFGKQLAQEWASLPVLVATKGQKRVVERGQSFYAGDGLNKSLVAPERVEAALDRARAAGNLIPPRTGSGVKPAPAPVTKVEIVPPATLAAAASPGFWAALVNLIAALFKRT